MMDTREAMPRYYLSTRDILVMAVLAGLSGITSTAINGLGDVVQAALGFAGTTQWAAGLHVTLLLLVVGLTNKGGAATLAGLLKGGVELLSGNTHGILVLLISLTAGLLIDLCMMAFRRKDSRLAYVVAGGLAAMSNVFVFQLFASAPEDLLAFIWAVGALAFVSGALLGGLLAHSLLLLLRRSGLAPQRAYRVMPRWHYAAFLVAGAALAVGGGVALSRALAGPPAVAVSGDCAAPFDYAYSEEQFDILTVEATVNDTKRRAAGVRLDQILDRAQPNPSAASVLVTASDGYAFFVTLQEARENVNLVLAHRGEGREMRYEIVGAVNPKAWVRNVAELRLVPLALVQVSGLLETPFPYNPDEWQLEMDNATLDLGYGEAKYQGTRLDDLFDKWRPQREAAVLRIETRSGESVALPLYDVLADSTLRIWNVSTPDGLRFAIAREDGDILARDVVALAIE